MPPFNGETDREILKRVKKANVSFQNPVWENISGTAKQFLQTVLNPSISERPTAMQSLNHNWMKRAAKEAKSTVFNDATAHALANL